MTQTQNIKDALGLLEKLIAIPSFSGKEDEAATFLASTLEMFFPSCVTRSDNHVVVDIQGETRGSTLLLCSHIDTVEVQSNWTKAPFTPTYEGDRLYGLGANDAGASVVSMIAATRLLKKLKKGRLLMAFVAQEEAGIEGFCKLEPSLPRYDGAIFGEPTDLKAASSMRGAMRAVMRSRGKGCHASTPWEGHNAIDQFAADLKKLRAIDCKDSSSWGGATIEPTQIHGGKSFNQIPDLVETTLDIRTTPAKNNAWVEKTLKQTGLDITLEADQRYPMESDENTKIMQAYRAVCAEQDLCVFNGSCDMAFSTAPSIILGPGSLKVAHIADEYTNISAIEKAIPLYHALIKQFLKG